MKARMLRRIELVANVCIIVVALVICAAVAKRLLLKSPSSERGTQGVAAGTKINLTEELKQSREYLRSLNVSIDEVKQTPPGSVGVRATPTLILINSGGIVVNSWVGRLQSDKEAEVLSQLQ